MISSIEISRFRGIREGKLENLTPLTILVGPNGCGKSTVLDAMLIGASVSPGEAILQTMQRHQGVIEKQRWLFYMAEPATPEAKIVVRSDRKAERTSVLTTDPPSISYDSRAPRIIKMNWPGASGEAKDQRNVAQGPFKSFPKGNVIQQQEMRVEFVDRKQGYRASGKAPSPLKGVPDIRLVEIHGNGRERLLHELYSETARTGQRETTKALISDLVPEIKDIEILTEAGEPVLYLVYKSRAVPVALAGDGVHALVRIALELASRPDGVVLLEEPELHQHPGAMRQTVRAILAAVRREIQVLLSTHSLEFIDMLVADGNEQDIERLSLFRLELSDGRLIAVQTTGPDVAFCRGEIEKDLR